VGNPPGFAGYAPQGLVLGQIAGGQREFKKIDHLLSRPACAMQLEYQTFLGENYAVKESRRWGACPA
jgi:hypothetical protein